MRRLTFPCVFALAAMLLFGACGDDDDSDAASTATATSEASATSSQPATGASATATDSAGDGSSDAGSPIGGDEPATVTIEIDATTEPTSASETPSPVATSDGGATATLGDEPSPQTTEPASNVEEVLLAALLTEEDMPDEWRSDGEAEPVGVDDTDGEELCGAEGFPDEAQSTGQVATQFLVEADDTQQAAMIQKIWALPDDVAVDALAYWRDAATCDTWNQDEETVVTVSPLDDPALGYESFAVHLMFEAPEIGVAEGDYIFVRGGNVLMLIAYLGADGVDFSTLAGPIEIATERLLEADASLASRTE